MQSTSELPPGQPQPIGAHQKRRLHDVLRLDAGTARQAGHMVPQKHPRGLRSRLGGSRLLHSSPDALNQGGDVVFQGAEVLGGGSQSRLPLCDRRGGFAVLLLELQAHSHSIISIALPLRQLLFRRLQKVLRVRDTLSQRLK